MSEHAFTIAKVFTLAISSSSVNSFAKQVAS